MSIITRRRNRNIYMRSKYVSDEKNIKEALLETVNYIKSIYKYFM